MLASSSSLLSRHEGNGPFSWSLLGNILHFCLLWFGGKSPLNSYFFWLPFQFQPSSTLTSGPTLGESAEPGGDRTRRLSGGRVAVCNRLSQMRMFFRIARPSSCQTRAAGYRVGWLGGMFPHVKHGPFQSQFCRVGLNTSWMGFKQMSQQKIFISMIFSCLKCCLGRAHTHTHSAMCNGFS